jgi:hypothetical protein
MKIKPKNFRHKKIPITQKIRYQKKTHGVKKSLVIFLLALNWTRKRSSWTNKVAFTNLHAPLNWLKIA